MFSSRPFYRPTGILSISAIGGSLGTCLAGSRQSVLVMLDRDTLTALVASGLDDQSASPGFHALSKPVGFGPMPIIRLVCSLWHSLVLLKNLKS